MGGSSRLRLFARALVASALTILLGTIAFVLVMDESVLEALYQTVITVTGVGLGRLPDTGGGKAVTIVLSIAGVAIFVYLFGLVIELTVGGLFGGALQERRNRQRVERLDRHYVICGYGRMGRRVAAEFATAGVPHVVVDNDPHAVEAARQAGHLVVEGAGSDDGILVAAGIDRALGLVAAAGSDAENLYIVVNARELHPGLVIMARASSEDAAKNLHRGGADHTVAPYSIAGREVATMMLKPHVAALLGLLSGEAGEGVRFEQIVVKGNCGQIGRELGELVERAPDRALVVAHRRRGGEFTTHLDPLTVMAEGDVLIAAGSEDEVRALELRFRPREFVV